MTKITNQVFPESQISSREFEDEIKGKTQEASFRIISLSNSILEAEMIGWLLDY